MERIATAMATATELRASLEALAKHKQRNAPELLPHEDRAYLSMMGKMRVMVAFLEAGAGTRLDSSPSLDDAIVLGRRMINDVAQFVDVARGATA